MAQARKKVIVAKYRLTVFIERPGDIAHRDSSQVGIGEYPTDEAAIAAFRDLAQAHRRAYDRRGYESYFTVFEDTSPSREVAHF